MRVQIVGRGRMATALKAAFNVDGLSAEALGAGAGGDAPGDERIELLPLGGRGADGTDPSGAPVDVVLLAVPDAEIAAAARAIVPGPLVGHCAGALGLDALAPHEAFSLHPLLTVVGEQTSFRGAYAAIDGGTRRSTTTAERLAEMLGLHVFRVADADRSAYHAAASIASNFLVTLEGFATELAATAGVPREALVPLVRESLENWARLGAAPALTGPIARGDEDTVARQRAAVAERLPAQLALFDALAAATRELSQGETA